MAFFNNCKICGYKGKLKKHLKNEHYLTELQYHKEYLKEGIDFIECKICNNKVEDLKTHLKRTHNTSITYYEIKFPNSLLYINKELNGIEGIDFLECKICNKKVKSLWHHTREHNITLQEYIYKFPNNIYKLNNDYSGIEGVDYLECKICNTKHKGLSKHLECIHNMTSDEYRIKYNIDTLFCSSISQKFGQHMKTEKYKNMFSEMLKGENNPNYNVNFHLRRLKNLSYIPENKISKYWKNVKLNRKVPYKNNNLLTEAEIILKRKQQSPFSIEFWKKKYPNYNDNELSELLYTFKDNSLSNREFDTRIEYYIKRGFTEEEGLKLIKDRQTTFSLEKCIDKHGKEEGTKIWQARQDKWQNNLNSKSDEEKLEIKKKKLNGSGFSKISQILFWDIYNKLNTTEHNIKFKELNNEVVLCDKDTNNIFAYDFIDFTNKKVIEFNGDFWHCNPSVYNENHKHRLINKTAKEIWNYDKIKNDYMIKKGYRVLIIWESEYKNNKQLVLQKCIDFILS